MYAAEAKGERDELVGIVLARDVITTGATSQTSTFINVHDSVVGAFIKRNMVPEFEPKLGI